ncbi:MAG: zinc ribbon domain-containing protein [Candidatus Acidiferrales bacterium]
MTSETRIFIEPNDLLGVEFECGECGTRLVYELPRRPVRISHVCPNCNEPFYDAATKGNDFQQFFALLSTMRRLTEGSKLKLKLQISSPMKEATHENEK